MIRFRTASIPTWTAFGTPSDPDVKYKNFDLSLQVKDLTSLIQFPAKIASSAVESSIRTVLGPRLIIMSRSREAGIFNGIQAILTGNVTAAITRATDLADKSSRAAKVTPSLCSRLNHLLHARIFLTSCSHEHCSPAGPVRQTSPGF